MRSNLNTASHYRVQRSIQRESVTDTRRSVRGRRQAIGRLGSGTRALLSAVMQAVRTRNFAGGGRRRGVLSGHVRWRFLRKSAAFGGVIKIRELYLRNDVVCGAAACLACERPADAVAGCVAARVCPRVWLRCCTMSWPPDSD
jgi:hypothetical protein